MKRYSIFLLFFFVVVEMQSFNLNDSTIVVDDVKTDTLFVETESTDTVPREIRNGAWFVPSSATTINGWAIGWFLSGIAKNRVKNINGLHTQLSPLIIVMVVAVPMVGTNMFDTKSHLSKISTDTTFLMPRSEGRMNGLSLSIIDFDEYNYTSNGLDVSFLIRERNIMNGVAINGFYYKTEKTNGLMINGFGGCATHLNGVSISGVCNIANIVKGIQIGGYNRSNQVYGLQIGLFNKTNKLKGVQIGLFNKNGKRGFPLINIGW